jgi:hypothetical protein
VRSAPDIFGDVVTDEKYPVQTSFLVKERSLQLKVLRILPFVGLLTLLFATGCSTHQDSPTDTGHASSTNNVSTTSSTFQPPEPSYPIVLFNNENYVKESQTLRNVHSYFMGNVSCDDIKPSSQEQSSIHGPWHMDPVQVAEICTSHLQPLVDRNQSGDGQLIPNQLMSFKAKGQLITFRLTKHTPATKGTPETAVVETSGLAQQSPCLPLRPKRHVHLDHLSHRDAWIRKTVAMTQFAA